MGLFERMGHALIDPGIIDLELARRSYGYRIDNIVANRCIRCKKLICQQRGWTDFIRAQTALGSIDLQKALEEIKRNCVCS